MSESVLRESFENESQRRRKALNNNFENYLSFKDNEFKNFIGYGATDKEVEAYLQALGATMYGE